MPVMTKEGKSIATMLPTEFNKATEAVMKALKNSQFSLTKYELALRTQISPYHVTDILTVLVAQGYATIIESPTYTIGGSRNPIEEIIQ